MFLAASQDNPHDHRDTDDAQKPDDQDRVSRGFLCDDVFARNWGGGDGCVYFHSGGVSWHPALRRSVITQSGRVGGIGGKVELVALREAMAISGDKLVGDLIGAGRAEFSSRALRARENLDAASAEVKTRTIADHHTKPAGVTTEVEEHVIGGEGNIDGTLGHSGARCWGAVLDDIVSHGRGSTEKQRTEESCTHKRKAT